MVIEPNPYATLGLMPGSSPAEIKRRYRQLAKQYHPDRNGNTAGSEKKLRDLNAAYEFLSDASRKTVYDARVEEMFNPVYTASQASAHSVSPQFHPVYRQRRRSFWATLGLTLLVLISTGAGVLLTTDNASTSLAGMLPQMPRTTSVGTDPTPQDFSFVPSSGPFDSQGSRDVPSQISQP
ncbi:MAG: J domain-containing protein [Janthinobacterium lividum]